MTDPLPRADWSFPTRIRFGAGRVVELPAACAELGLRRPLLVTDRGLANHPMIAEAIRRNAEAGVATGLFGGVRPNPFVADVTEGLAVYRAGGHDGVIAFGGGSSLDAGKAIAFMSAQRHPIEALTVANFQEFQDAQAKIVTAGLPPVITVPTTSGTGSEIGRAAALIDPAARVKKGLFHQRMMPALCLADPALTVGLPPALTAAVGMDAFVHNLEAYLCPLFHPFSEGAALAGIQLCRDWLPRAVADGHDLVARSHMMAASLAGAVAFQKGLGAVHALSHPLSSVLGAHHGLGNGVLLPYVLAFNRPAIEAKLAVLARLLDLPEPGYAGVVGWVLDLRRTIGVPHTADALGLTEAMVPELAVMAARDLNAPENPIPFDANDAERIYRDALGGRVDGVR
ncbi:MAG: iron-containing alcohol dehydrogenase [Alphaproteobacteria bacterium]